METISDLKQKLESIDQKDYLSYQSLKGSYSFRDYSLTIHHIPKDPFAPPHTGLYRLFIPKSFILFKDIDKISELGRIAFCDFFARRFFQQSLTCSKVGRGSGYSGIITLSEPSQVILNRNNILITKDSVEVRCFLGLPAKKRIIQASLAQTMFFEELPSIVQSTFQLNEEDQTSLLNHIHCYEDSNYLRNALSERGLVAFIKEGAKLARKSGISDLPLESCIPFSCKDMALVEFDLPNLGIIKGMGIKKGITLIVGGGFHGKSTLLNTIEDGVYDHVLGDGREFCVTDKLAVKIRAYEGRIINHTNISTFFKKLPSEQETSDFYTENASGSTSQAASIMESIEMGSQVLLMDEDTSASNILIRDLNMQKLVQSDDEPIIPFIDHVQHFSKKGISTLLVLGGNGDFFEVCDTVIQMKNYSAFDVSQKAKDIGNNALEKRQKKVKVSSLAYSDRHLIEDLNPINSHGHFRIYASHQNELIFGNDNIDLTDIAHIKELTQLKTLGFALNYGMKYRTENISMKNLLTLIIKDIHDHGFDILNENLSGHFSEFRLFELVAVLNRLRSASITI